MPMWTKNILTERDLILDQLDGKIREFRCREKQTDSEKGIRKTFQTVKRGKDHGASGKHQDLYGAERDRPCIRNGMALKKWQDSRRKCRTCEEESVYSLLDPDGTVVP